MNYLTVRRPGNGVNVWNDFDRLFDSVFGTMPSWSDWRPAVDIRNEDDAYVIEADIPGMREDQISVQVENDLLVISGRTEDERSANDGDANGESADYILRERSARQFYRSFAMPKDADAANVEATYRNGVLTVQLHKKPEAKPRQIEIRRG